MNIVLAKGEKAEEVLRRFFLEQGYFVVRSVPFLYSENDVTDVDVWLYGKASNFTRERINVDIKNKKKSKPFERIIWAKGLQASLRFEGCLVVTNSTRKDIREFALSNSVAIIDKTLLENLLEKGIDSSRIVEEQFVQEISSESSSVGKDDWKERYRMSKARVLNKLNFDGCNEYLTEIEYYLEQSSLRSNRTLVPLRLLYINISLFLICLDFTVKTFVNLDRRSRMDLLISGFNYGERGKERTDKIINTAIQLASSVIVSQSLPQTLRMEVEKQTKERPVNILADFFGRTANINCVFEIAKSFERAAFSSVIKAPSELPTELQSIVGLLADFYRIDRKNAIF